MEVPSSLQAESCLFKNGRAQWKQKKDPLASIPLWINLEIPCELWHLDGTSFVASLFGEPLRMDEYTANMSKTKSARVCVTINTYFKFTIFIPVKLGCRLHIVKAECTWKPKICTSCRIFGHTNKFCDDLAAGPLGGNAASTNLRKGHKLGVLIKGNLMLFLSTRYGEKRSTTTLSSATEPADCPSSVLLHNNSLQGQNSVLRREGDAAGIHTFNRFSLLDEVQQQEEEMERCIPCHNDKGEGNANDGRLSPVGLSPVAITGKSPSSMEPGYFK